MTSKSAFTIIAVLLLVSAVTPVLAGHPALLEPLTRDGRFPRYSPEQLAENGYPDHQHSYYYPGWTPPLDAQGRSFGFGSICQGRVLLDPEGLESRKGFLGMGPIRLSFNTQYDPCQMAQLIEFSEMALHLYADLLDLEPIGELSIVNPDNVADYTTSTGYGTWRLFKLQGDDCIVQPVPVLVSRTLIAHAAIDLIGQWILQTRTEGLPAWLINGLTTYVGEQGNHFLSYMGPYRGKSEVLLPPVAIERILSAPPAPDGTRDKQHYRTARYGAFLMAWQLIEDRGGLVGMRALLKGVIDGRPADEVCTEVYGVDLKTLATQLDPVVYGEPIGDAVVPLRATDPPVSAPVRN